MAEVQRDYLAGEMASRFIEFVQMQRRQIELCLGRPPHGNAATVNHAAAQLFVQHLEMIEAKTDGNLSGQEAGLLRDTLNELRAAVATVPPPSDSTAAPPAL